MSFSFAKLADPNKKEKSDISKLAASVAVATALLSGNAVAQQAKPTIVLVHGAFADSSSWNGVITNLQKDAYTTVALTKRELELGTLDETVLVFGEQKGDVANEANAKSSGRKFWRLLDKECRQEGRPVMNLYPPTI